MKSYRSMFVLFAFTLMMAGCSGGGGSAGAQGPAGSNGLSINWQGPHVNEADRLSAHGEPSSNDAYYNITDGKSYIYNGASWDILARDGDPGTGTNGSSIVWQGSHPSEADRAAVHGAPQVNDAYYNSTDKKAYIYNGTSWEILAQDGAPGVGLNGTSIVWQGSHPSEADRAAAHGAPELNVAYYNSTDQKSYIYNGTSWDILSQDGATGTGTNGISIVWQGSHPSEADRAAAHGAPQLNVAYYNSTDKKSYIYNGISWDILAQDGLTGPTGPTGPAGPGITWVDVTGTSVQAEPNKGYIADSSSQVTITLPASLAIGDIVEVTGAGSGGWKVAQNAGQTIMAENLVNKSSIGDTWTARESVRTWEGVASSSDGTKLVATVSGGTGPIYTSTDSGVSWTPRESARNWYGVASSSDGTKLVAAVNGGRLYTSMDSGVTWTPRDSIRGWWGVASSSDGTKLVATTVPLDQIYTSTDSGVTWTPRDAARNWRAVTSSSDGTKLAAVTYGGQIYTSTDSGLTWTPRDSARNWEGIASSSDGTRLVANVVNGQLYTSTDSGVTWIPRETTRAWYKVASSWDGTKLAALDYGGYIYISIDSGIKWTPHDSATRQWRGVSFSSNGTKIVAVVSGGQIYTSSVKSNTTIGTGGFITGYQYDSLSLQYIGNSTFTVKSHEGDLDIY